MAVKPEANIHIDEKLENVHDAVHDSIQGSEDGLDHPNTTKSEDGIVDTNFQQGVQDIEAVTIYWSKTALIVSYILIWLVYFVQGVVTGVSGALLPYVTSAFADHSLTPTTGILSSVIAGVTNLSIAKALDIFGRPQGFLFCVVLTVIGLIMSAACNNVEAYAASQVFYSVGINGIGFSMNVFLADITSLRHRGLVVALCSTSFVITPWLGGPISSAFLKGAGWRWAFGMESILIPAATLPLFGLFMYHFSKAKKQGIVPTRPSGRTPRESLAYYLREFDVVGLFLLSAGVAFFLLPFNLYNLQAKGWGSAIIICFLVFGILLLIAFGVWERFYAPVSFIPWKFLQDRTGLGACILSLTLFLSLSCWAAYFSSILQVVNGLDVTRASYVVQTYTVANFIFAPFAGAAISYTGRYKPVTLYLAIPFSILGAGLMIHFRQPGPNVGYIVMSQIFMAFGSGIIMITAEIAMLAICEKQQYFAVGLAVLAMFSNIGNAIGYTISAAIWQDILPKKLALYLPADELPNLVTIYEDIVTQLSYPIGSATRLAIQHAYGDAQKYLFTAGTAVWILGAVATVVWRNIDVTGIKQTKGHVF
jgi:MFS family permease